MTFPAYRALLDGVENIVALAAVDDGAVLGLSLWRVVGAEKQSARLLSLLVDSDYRQQGIGAALLQASTEALGDTVNQAFAFWSSSLPGAGAFEGLIKSAGWAEKQLDQCRVSGTAESARNWAHRRRMDRMLNRTGWTFTSFDQIGDAERAEITEAVNAAETPEGWAPFDPVTDNQPIVPELSIVMRQHGAVVGWLTTCRAENGDIWYYRLHNIGAVKSSGALMPLIVEVNRRHFDLDGPKARWRWNTSSKRPDMLAFLARHASEFCDFHDYHWVSNLVLRAEGNDAVGETEQLAAVG
ncbi:GNAT family N-acetyltransferase [Devosia sp. BK]|uniref:GNAT family N-acetyltransferase n=1 Tax=Devosia sp. BK TaxID=2871706 RepID=UPI00293A4271|nr:GNAT family N-acetyltransferase [Devosia sp. BK]MDV3252671.1 GNAT family N-acetyltransferase [Devosia sp. BK]